ncbi:MAG: plasmid pRiA4b ORF-3 family protein [Bacteroidetes bacterium]|nr:plasmid pRiA4b ORF-3 family protein [Bacteroidota bacterium]
MYQLKITLNGIAPPIWRRILVSENITLYKLHHIIQISMGWTNSHLYYFGSIDSKIGDNELWDDQETTPDRLVKLRNVLVPENPTLTYAYDMGDNWVHTIELEQVHPEMKAQRKCFGGERQCPPEDCGGIPGYTNMLKTLKHPGTYEYEELIEWLGGKFDPECIDISMINASLALLSEYIREYEEE